MLKGAIDVVEVQRTANEPMVLAQLFPESIVIGAQRLIEIRFAIVLKVEIDDLIHLRHVEQLVEEVAIALVDCVEHGIDEFRLCAAVDQVFGHRCSTSI